MLHKCLNHPNSFCCVCGELSFKSERLNFNPLSRNAYELYFGCKVRNQEQGVCIAYVLYYMLKISDGPAKWVLTNDICCSHDVERLERPFNIVVSREHMYEVSLQSVSMLYSTQIYHQL
jgi:hypothetical protein